MTPAEIAAVLNAHNSWLNGEESGTLADLRGANLSGAELDKRTVLPDSETYAVYLSDVVPQLLLAGERGHEALSAWGRHDWTDCPMHVAFDITNEDQAPALLRPRVREFVQFYDAGLIPLPTLPEAQS